MGQKSATRYRLSVANLADILLNSHDSNVASMMVEAFEGYGSVVHLNMSHIHHSDFSKLPLGTQISHYTIGAVTEAVLSWTIIPIFQVFSNDYWQNLDEFYRTGICDGDTMNLLQLSKNFVKALSDYSTASGGEKPPSVDMRLPITWPTGTYGLYMPKTGCPKDPSGFSTGYFIDDTEDFKNQNNWTTGIHLNGTFNHGEIATYFCMKIKVTPTEYNRTWPSGNYCILKKGDCPAGFRQGVLHMDDEDDNNGNVHVGALPDGFFVDGNSISFCCRQDS
ncbi:uncharacterized protein LOC133186319 [Saccostrea echinata]|uniref:uncharacterized protein LOC133186319 n=1 Tax=Saccostrea echinata TaxID=191078 RepID=UPI002A7F30F8|nr:uncharacterized protein LOC133186319 [Saccostrea echinata]